LIITAIMLIPFVLNEYYNNPIERAKYTRQNLTNKNTLIKILLSTLANSMWTSTIIYALNYTSVSHAVLLSNCHALIIVLWKIVRREQVSHIEILGTIVSFFGASVVVNDGQSGPSIDLGQIPLWQRFLYGDLLAFSGSIGAAIFFMVSRQVRNDYPLYFRIFIMAICGGINMGVWSIFLDGSTIDFNPNTGVFGLFTPERFYFFIFLGVVIGLGVFVLYVIITNLMDPLIVSVTLFFEPVVSALLVWVLGMQAFPGIFTWLGTGIVIPGLIMIAFGQNKREQKEKKIKDDSELVSIKSNMEV